MILRCIRTLHSLQTDLSDPSLETEKWEKGIIWYFVGKEDPKEQQYSRSYLSNMSNLNELLFIPGSECYCSWNLKDQTPHAKIKQATTWRKCIFDYDSLIDVDAQERTSTSMLVIKMRRNGCSERDLEEISPVLYEHFYPLLLL